MIFWQNLIIVLVSVLVPIIPAYLLYKGLPGTAIVKGPFEGFTINLTGAFAGYFLVLLVVMTFWKTATNNLEVWKVTGWADFEDGGNLDKSVIYVAPQPFINVQSDGTFEIDVLKAPDQHGEMDLPDLVLDRPAAENYKYRPERIHLRSGKFPNVYHTTQHWFSREINIDQPILIKKKPVESQPYQPPDIAPPKPLTSPPPPPAVTTSAPLSPSTSSSPPTTETH